MNSQAQSTAEALRTRLFEALVERAIRARRLCDNGGDAYHLGWQGGVFDVCQRIAVAELGYSDAEFLAAVRARQASA